MSEYRTLKTKEEWLEAFRTTEAGWIDLDNRWVTPPRLISNIFLQFDAGSTSIETQAGLLAMLCANHAIQHRRSYTPVNFGNTSWDDLESLYLEVMMTYNASFFKDHLSCGTSMRYPFPYFDVKKPLYFPSDFIDADGEQYSVAVVNEEEYETLLNGIVLYFDQWISAIGQIALQDILSRLVKRQPLFGLLLKGYREEDRAAALARNNLKSMDDDGDCE